MSFVGRISASQVNYWGGFAIDVAVSLAMVTGGASIAGPVAILAIAIGGLVYSFYEYALHRWLLHAPAGTWYCFGIEKIHADHHVNPEDVSQVILSPFFTLPLAGLIFGALRLFVSGPAAGSLMAGLAVGYLAYETLHFLEHAPLSLPTPWLKALRKHHARHHFDRPYAVFGVTTPLWDHVFGT